MQVFETLAPSAQSLWGINILIQVTLISALALLVVRLLSNNAVLRWWILGSALLLILASPVTALLTQLNGVGFLAVANSRHEVTIAAMPAPVHVDNAIASNAARVRSSVVVNSLLQNDVDARTTAAEEPVVPAQTATESASASDSAYSIVPWTLTVFMAVWLAGVVWKLVRMLHGWQDLNSIRRRATLVKEPHVVAALANACEQLGLLRIPRLLKTNEVTSPVAAGVFEPVVILPETLITNLNDGQLNDILLHESAHVARRDQVIVIAQNLITCLFWMHPLVLLVNQRFAQAREEVCDNFVLHSSTAPSYSRTLLNLAEYVSNSDVLPASVGMLDGWRLESRVAGLLRNNRNTATRLTGRSVAMVAALFGFLLVLGGLATISVAGDEPVAQQDQPTVPAKAMKKEVTSSSSKKSQQNAQGSQPLPNSTEFQFAGRVIDPDQQPVSGARVYFARPNAQPLAVSDADGNFEFTCTKGRLPNNAAWGNIRLVAVADGFGIAISPVLRFETSGRGMKDLKARNPNRKFKFGKLPRLLKLTNDDVPIQGRIVDLEGQPVPNVDIQLRFVNQAYARFAFDAVTTDPDGRFEVRGIGRDRVVRLVAKGERTEFSVFFARTKNIAAATKTTPRNNDPFDLERLNAGTHRVTYGARLTHAVGPSVPLEGRITDAKTGKPLENVMLSGYQLANTNAETPAREEFNAVTDRNGRYRLIGLPLGSNIIRTSMATESGYLPRQATFNVTDDVRSINGDLKVTKGVVLTGRATDAVSGEALFGTVEYVAAENNRHYRGGGLAPSAKTNADGIYVLTVLPGKGYLAFRARRKGYAVGVLSDEVKSSVNDVSPLLPAKPVSLFPISYNTILAVNPSVGDTTATCDISLKRQPVATVNVVDTDGKPVLGANVEEVLIMSNLGFARGSNRVELSGSTYRCQQFTPSGSTAVVARHEGRGLIGRLSISATRDPDLPVIMKNASDVSKVKLNMVRIEEDTEFDLTMKPAGKITGRILDKEGNPRVVRIDGHERIFATNDDGTFELSMVLPEFPVTARAIHREQGQLLGTIFTDVILKPGETRNLGDIQVQRNTQ